MKEVLISDPLDDLNDSLAGLKRAPTATPRSEEERRLIEDPTYVPNPLKVYYKKKNHAHENGGTPTTSRVTRNRPNTTPGVDFHTAPPNTPRHGQAPRAAVEAFASTLAEHAEIERGGLVVGAIAIFASLTPVEEDDEDEPEVSGAVQSETEMEEMEDAESNPFLQP